MILHTTLGLIALVAFSNAAFNCTRPFLQDAVDKYVFMQNTGQHGDFDNLSYNLTYLENNATSSILSGQPAHPIPITHSRSALDTTQCKTFTEIISLPLPSSQFVSTNATVIATQMYIDSSGNVEKIDSLVTQAGDWAFNATGYLYWQSLENWEDIPEGRRDTRDVIKAAGDAYADRCDNVNITVPFDTPCARLEGGAYTGRGNLSANTCDIGGLPSHTLLSNRRYVIDEVQGSVDIFLEFQGLDRTRPNEGTPDSHWFKIESGKIRYVHTVSKCWAAGCGMNGTCIPSMRR